MSNVSSRTYWLRSYKGKERSLLTVKCIQLLSHVLVVRWHPPVSRLCSCWRLWLLSGWSEGALQSPSLAPRWRECQDRQPTRRSVYTVHTKSKLHVQDKSTQNVDLCVYRHQDHRFCLVIRFIWKQSMVTIILSLWLD